MKTFFKNVLSTMIGILLSIVVIILLFIGFISFAISSLEKEEISTVQPNTILKIDLSKPVVERASDNPFENISILNTNPQLELEFRNILETIEKAGKDENISGIFLQVPLVNAGLSQTEEIRNKLLEFKKTGKFILAYSENYSQIGYYLSTVADEIYLNPEGIIELKGFSAQIMFYKGLLDKLDIQAQVIRHGKFKSAVEPFISDKMSTENREQIALLISSISNNILDSIAHQRNIPLEQLEDMINHLEINTAKKCIEYHLVDKLVYQDQVAEILKTKVGKNEKPNFISLAKYQNVKPTTTENISRDKIAIIYATGDINSGEGDLKSIGSETTARAIKKAREDENVKAIILRINSPGGSALASEVIWRETLLAKATKPLVVSMGDVAASGGYYIACVADSIVANPTTITGSIGVFGIIPNLQSFYKNKLGITIDTVNSHKYADMGINRSLSNFETEKIKENIEQVYTTFITHVAEGRKMQPTAVDEIGQGRVWTGYDAKRLGLVDVLGGLETAIDIAANLAKLDHYRITSLPEKENTFESWISELSGEEPEDIAAYFGLNGNIISSAKQLLKGDKIQAKIPFEITID